MDFRVVEGNSCAQNGDMRALETMRGTEARAGGAVGRG